MSSQIPLRFTDCISQHFIQNVSCNLIAAGRYVARKIGSAFSRPERTSQQSSEPVGHSKSASASHKHTLPAASDTDEPQASAKGLKQNGLSNSEVSHMNGEWPV